MDWIAGILELSGSWFIGGKNKIGFICNIVGCSIWIYVSIHTKLYGLLLVVAPAIIINTRNYVKWTKEEKLARSSMVEQTVDNR